MARRRSSKRRPSRWLAFLVLLGIVHATSSCSSPGTGPTMTGNTDARLELSRAESELGRGDVAAAAPVFDRLAGRAMTLTDHQVAARVLLGRAECRLRQGDPAAAGEDLLRAETRNRQITNPGEKRSIDARIAFLNGEVDLEQRDWNGAYTNYKRAADVPGALDSDRINHRLALTAKLLDRTAEANSYRARIRNAARPEFAALDARFTAPPPAPAVTSSAPSTIAAADPTAPPILPRSKWNARPATWDKDPIGKIWRVTIHHSATPFDATDVAMTAAHISGIQRTHQGDRGWADIGYHFLIDRSGRIWEGRELRWQGAHAGNHELNAGNVGICVLGDYSVRGLSSTQESSLTRLLDWLRKKNGIAAGNVFTHREIREHNDHGSSECPGPKITAFVKRYRGGSKAVAKG
jgi:hypothetical protein